MATVYVSPSGSDANTYAQAQSPATPWLTIGKCNTSATTGDTIVVMAGTHTWATVTFTKSFTFQGATTNSALYIINAGGDLPTWILTGTNNFRNLTFTNRVHTVNTGVVAFDIARTGTYTFTNVIFSNNIHGDIVNNRGLIGGNTTSAMTVVVNFTSCLFNDNGAAAANGVDFSGYSSTASTLTWNFVGCTFFFKRTTYPVKFLFFPVSPTAHTINIKNCIFYNVNGLTVQYILSGYGTAVSAISYCDIYLMTGFPAATNSITSSPLFVDENNGNFNLRPTSPCIDTGTLT